MLKRDDDTIMVVRLFKKHPHGGWNLDYSEHEVDALVPPSGLLSQLPEAEPGDVIFLVGWQKIEEDGSLTTISILNPEYAQFQEQAQAFQAEIRENLRKSIEDDGDPMVRAVAGDLTDDERLDAAMKLSALRNYGPITASLYDLLGKRVIQPGRDDCKATRMWLENADPAVLHMAAHVDGEDEAKLHDLVIHLSHLLSLERGTPGILQIDHDALQDKLSKLVFLSLMFLLTRMGYIEPDKGSRVWDEGFGFKKIGDFSNPQELEQAILAYVRENSEYLEHSGPEPAEA